MKNKKLNSIKSTGFKVPEHYLESFDELLFNKLSEVKPLENVQDAGFKVPEAYFDTFEDKLGQLLSTEKEAKVLPLFSWKKAAYISGVAASIIIMLSLFNIYNSKPTFGKIETASIENYIVEEDFTNEDFASLVSEDLTLNKFMDSNLIDSNLEDYILDNASVEDYLKE